MLKDWKSHLGLVIALIIANCLYYVGLSGCDEESRKSMQSCIDYTISISVLIAFTCVTSTIIFIVVFYIALKKRYYLILFDSPICLGIWYYLRHNMTPNFYQHDTINILISVVTVIVMLLGYAIVNLLLMIIKSRFAFLLLCLLLSLVYYSGYLFYSLLDCSQWPLNLKDSKISNSVGCKVQKPTYCWDFLLNGAADLSKIAGLSCDASFANGDLSRSAFKYADIVFFPKVTSWNATERSFSNFHEKLNNELTYVNFTNPHYFFNNLIKGVNVTSKLDLVKHYFELGHEIYIDFTDNSRTKVEQFVNYNHTLATTSKVAFQKNYDDSKPENSHPKIRNLLFIFLDTISRAHLKLALPQTYKFLEKFFENEKTPFEAFQFTKYNTLRGNTMASALPMLFGDSVELMNKFPNRNPKENIFDIYRRKGFINSHVTNSCSTLPPSYYDGMNLFALSQASPFDHENFQPMCDKSLQGDVFGGNIDSSYYLPYKRCFNGKLTSSYVFDYSSKILESYKDSHHFHLLYFLDGHESTNENLKYLDQPLLSHLKKYLDRFVKEDWGIVFYSDHGNHCSAANLIFNLDDMSKDKLLPFLTVLLPRATANKYKKSLKASEHEIISPFDINQMLASLAGEESKTEVYSKQIDIFNYDRSVQGTRSCSDLNITQGECKCK